MGFDGYVLLAILTLFFVYFLPSLIRSAQVVAQARIEDRFSGGLHIIATAGQEPKKEVLRGRAYIHPPQPTELPMNTPVAHKIAAADARRVAAARAARAGAASRRAAAAKRRMLLLSVLGALTISAWILTVMTSFTWVVAALLTASTVAALQLGRRAAAAGAAADAELAQRVRSAEERAGLGRTPQVAPPTARPTEETVADLADAASSSLRVEVDPARQEATPWTPVPVPPPAYLLKAQAKRRAVEPYTEEEPAELVEAGSPERSDSARSEAALSQSAPEPAREEEPAQVSADAPSPTSALNVQEILARRRAVG